MATLHKDLHLTTEFLAFLRAGLFAQIMLEGAASRLEASFLPPHYVESAHQGFDKLDMWIKDLEDGLPIFSTSWASPDTFEAISAMRFMKDLKRDLLWFAQIVEDALRIPDLADNHEAVKLLAAGVHRSASTRLAYLETLNATFLKLKAADRAQQSDAEIPEAKGFLQTANTIVDIFSDENQHTQDLCERLRIEASLVPADMRAHAHDARILLNVYAKQFDYELAEIPSADAKAWFDMKIPAVAAGYWYAYRFTPQDFGRWISVGVRGAPIAAYWRRAGFGPDEAVTWIKQGIPPMIAREWSAAGFDASRTVAMIQRGITEPTKAPRNRDGE
jgi:hypothetical protein